MDTHMTPTSLHGKLPEIIEGRAARRTVEEAFGHLLELLAVGLFATLVLGLGTLLAMATLGH
jgi:hypothetical protein